MEEMHLPVETINQSLQFLINFFSQGHARIFPFLHWFLGKLLAIDILLFGAFLIFGHVQAFARVFPKILYIGFLIHLLTLWPQLVRIFAESMIQLGLIAGGNVLTQSDFLNPSNLVAEGFRIAHPLIRNIISFSLFRSPTSTVINFLFGVALLAAVVVMAVRLYLGIVELYLGTVVGSIMLPFAMLPSTAPFAQLGIGYAVASSFRLGILAFIMSAVTTIVGEMSLTEDPSWAQVLIALTIMTALAVIVVKAPQIAGGILSGGPILTAGSLLSTAALLGGTAASVAGGVAAGAARTATAAVTAGAATRAAISQGGAAAVARLPASFVSSSGLAHSVRNQMQAASSRGQAIGAHAANPALPPGPPPAASGSTAPQWARNWAAGFGGSGSGATGASPTAQGDTPPGPVVGNKNSGIYHDPGLPNYGDVSPRNQVFFPNAAAAEQAGYRPAHNTHHGQGSAIPKGYRTPYRPPEKPHE